MRDPYVRAWIYRTGAQPLHINRKPDHSMGADALQIRFNQTAHNRVGMQGGNANHKENSRAELFQRGLADYDMGTRLAHFRSIIPHHPANRASGSPLKPAPTANTLPAQGAA